MEFLKRWRKKRSKTSSTPPESPKPRASESDQADEVPQRSPARRRRPSTMGKTVAEQAYLAQAAAQVKSKPGQG